MLYIWRTDIWNLKNEDRVTRVKYTLGHVGISVFSGACTTLGSSIFMLAAKIIFFQTVWYLHLLHHWSVYSMFPNPLHNVFGYDRPGGRDGLTSTNMEDH